jgi:hypothetical protein
MNARSIASIIRTVFYAGFVALLYHHPVETPALSGAITGFVLADYLTWIVATIGHLSSDVLTGAWDTIINLAAGIAIFNYCGVVMPTTSEGISMAGLMFLAVGALKAMYFGIEYFINDIM